MTAAALTTVATLAHALSQYGTMSAAEVLVPAIEAAESGYRIQSFENAFLDDYTRRLAEAGLSDFYSGTIADKLDKDVRAAGGFLQRSDLLRVPASVVDTRPDRGTYPRPEGLVGPLASGGGASSSWPCRSSTSSRLRRSTSRGSSAATPSWRRCVSPEQRRWPGAGSRT
jgi:gamma-glutamyltranspeptidase